jgi:hypothetical protein
MPTLRAIKGDPSLVDQIKGCCGFAGAIMALLVRKSATIDQLVDCIDRGTKFKGIDASSRVPGRIRKRIGTGIIADASNHDFMMCLALMILFKEHSKQEGDGDWQACLDYSAVWTSWAYDTMSYTTSSTSLLRLISGGSFTEVTHHHVTKLKQVPRGKKVSLSELSYKGGDLAVPAPIMPSLLDLVEIDVVRHETLVDTSGFRLLKNKSANQAKLSFTAFSAEVNRIQRAGSARSVDYSDIILGIGHEPGNQDFEPYDNITHWVYIPAKPKAKPRMGEFKCWTWGAEHDFWAHMVDVHRANRRPGFYPAYAIYLD